eukprot:356330-Chlamydomonas_euryale.AAC.2
MSARWQRDAPVAPCHGPWRPSNRLARPCKLTDLWFRPASLQTRDLEGGSRCRRGRRMHASCAYVVSCLTDDRPSRFPAGGHFAAKPKTS